MATTLAYTLVFANLLLPALSQGCKFCLPACSQPPFPGDFCAPSTILALRAKVLRNDTTQCTGVCDGKGIALGNLKTIYKLRVRRVLKGTFKPRKINAMGIRSFTRDASPLRLPVVMEVGKTYFVNLQMPLPSQVVPYIDRCDHPDLWSSLTRKQKRFLTMNKC